MQSPSEFDAASREAVATDIGNRLQAVEDARAAHLRVREGVPFNFADAECGKGWKAIYEHAVRGIEALGGTILQVKEKFGSLRVYYAVPLNGKPEDDKKIADLANEAERQSFLTCEDCGNPGNIHGHGWVKTVCDKHAEKRGLPPYDND